MKRLISIIVPFAFLLLLTMPVDANADSSVSVNLGYNIGETLDLSPIYEEKGQVTFDAVKLMNRGGEVSIQSSSNMDQSALLEEKLEEPDVQKILSDYINQGKTPVAISWTKVYVKDSLLGGKGNVIPMTVSEVEQSTYNTLQNTPSKNFTLYTIAGYDNWNPRLLWANAVGVWSDETLLPGLNSPNGTNDDFITLSWPEGYTVLGSGVSGAYSRAYKHDEAYSSVVWGFREKLGTVSLLTTGRADNPVGTRKWISKYVHTWETVVPSFTFSKYDVSITLAFGSDSWQTSNMLLY